MKIIIAQLDNITPNSKDFNKYLSTAFKKQKIDLVVIGEYVSSLFFKEYIKMPKNTLQKLFNAQQKYFTNLAIKYNTTIITPLIECTKSGIFKSAMIVSPKETYFYQAQKLMAMEHWNEKAFFSNTTKLKDPFIFSIDGLKISVLFGWESHFDELWIKLRKKNVDVVVVPTASTFNSNARWARLLQTRSFLNNCYIIRVNRTGTYIEDRIEWKFYGNSFVSLPDGNIGDILGDKNGILISEVKETIIKEALNDWRFR